MICITPTAKRQLTSTLYLIKDLIVIFGIITPIVMSMVFNILFILGLGTADYAILVMIELGFVFNVIVGTYLTYSLIRWLSTAFHKC